MVAGSPPSNSLDPALPETAACLHCGYSLKGLPENVCPECGRGFDPKDLSTWRDSRTLNLLGRVAHHEFGAWSFFSPTAPSTRKLLLAGLLVAALAIRIGLPWKHLHENSYFSLVVFVLLLSVRLAFGSCILALRQLHLLDGCPSSNCPARDRTRNASALFQWGALGVITLAGWSVVLNPGAFNQARLGLSRGAFYAKASQLRPAVEGRQWVGIVHVDMIRRPPVGNMVIFDLDWNRRYGVISVTSCIDDRLSPDDVLGPGWSR